MAVQRMVAEDRTGWDSRALGWCLIDLIKKEQSGVKTSNFDHYVEQLVALEVEDDDKILIKERNRLLLTLSPQGRKLAKAKQLSDVGKHNESAELYRSILSSNPEDLKTATALGWQLYRMAKELSDELTKNSNMVKRLLHEYLQLA